MWFKTVSDKYKYKSYKKIACIIHVYIIIHISKNVL